VKLSDPVYSRAFPQPPQDPDRLLTLLHADRQKASSRLSLLETRLFKLFQWERVADPASRVQDLLGRLRTQLAEGREILNPEIHCLDLARDIVKEAEQAAAARRRPRSGIVSGPAQTTDSREDWTEAVHRCLREMPPPSRDILLRYYHPEPRTREENRRQLARSLGLSPEELREQASELRERMEDCVRKSPR